VGFSATVSNDKRQLKGNPANVVLRGSPPDRPEMDQNRPLRYRVINLDFDGPDDVLPVGREVKEKEILHALLQCLLQNSARLLELTTVPHLG